jgi:hypothetical protein
MLSCGIENCTIAQFNAAIQATYSDLTVTGQIFMNTVGYDNSTAYFGASSSGIIAVVLGMSSEAGTNLKLASADGAGSKITFFNHSRFNISGISQTNSGIVNQVAEATFA